MEVLVDTSVWSLALRRPTRSSPAHQTVHKLREFIETGVPICVLGVILQEVLQGVRDKKNWEQLRANMSAFPLAEPTRHTYEFASQLFSKCRAHGVQLTTIDCLIASVAIENKFALLSADGDFAHIARISELDLL
jgi:predicted nucleic acid-binding protein